MEPELVEIIDRIGLSQAYFEFTVEVDKAPLEPRGWLGLALVAEMSGDTNKARAYRQRAEMLKQGNAPHPFKPATVPAHRLVEPELIRSVPVAEPEASAPSSTMLDPSYVPPRYVDWINLDPWMKFLIPGVLICCCCPCSWWWLSRQGSHPTSSTTAAYRPPPTAKPVTPPPASQRTTKTSPPNLAHPIDRLHSWDTIQIPQLGDVYIMVPPGIEKNYTFEHHLDHDHVEFKAANGAEPYLKIDVSTPYHGFELWGNALGLDRSFAKAYGPKYHKTRLDEKYDMVLWQFDVTKQDQAWRKSDAFKRLSGGRAAAILVEADPATFEKYRPFLKRLYSTLVEGHVPDPGEVSSL